VEETALKRRDGSFGLSLFLEILANTDAIGGARGQFFLLDNIYSPSLTVLSRVSFAAPSRGLPEFAPNSLEDVAFSRLALYVLDDG